MKRIRIISLVVLAFVLISSECGRPDMLVINEIQDDGSINRKLVITYDEDEFNLDDMQVPVDSTWILDKTLEISEKGDSLWTVTAEKYFASVAELNESYDKHTGTNEKMNRWSVFKKKFRWFNTVHYFSENVEKAIEGYPPEEFLSKEELHLFYMPEKLFNDLRYGEDSIKYQAMFDTLELRKEYLLGRGLVKAAIQELDTLIKTSGDNSIDIARIWEREKELGQIILEEDLEDAIDSLYGKGFYDINQVIIDSAMHMLENKFDVAMDAHAYLIQTKMPGEIIGTNGYIDTDGGILWEVNGDIILSKDYTMWAESTTTNKWSWIVTIVFLLFVVIGFIVRARR